MLRRELLVHIRDMLVNEAKDKPCGSQDFNAELHALLLELSLLCGEIMSASRRG